MHCRSFHPVMIGALLLTLVLIFCLSGRKPNHALDCRPAVIAVPIIIQVNFNSGLAYFLMRLLRVEHSVASPGALIGASNFFELAVAVAITRFRRELRCSPRHGRGRPGRSHRDALCLQCLQPHPALVHGKAGLSHGSGKIEPSSDKNKTTPMFFTSGETPPL